MQLERRILHPVEEQALAESRAFDPLQKRLRNDLIGVDVRPVEQRGGPGDRTKRSHRELGRTSVKWPADRRGGGHRRADEMRPAARALAAFEVAVRRRRRSVRPGRGCRGSCRGTSSSPPPPFEAGRLEDRVEALGLGLHFTCAEPGRPSPARRRATCRPATTAAAVTQILDARVRARADEDLVDADVDDRRARRRSM